MAKQPSPKVASKKSVKFAKDTKARASRRHRRLTFSSYIFKVRCRSHVRARRRCRRWRMHARAPSRAFFCVQVLQDVAGQKTGISGRAMAVLNSMATDVLQRLSEEAKTVLTHGSRRRTLTSRELLAATRLLMPKELAKHANGAGIAAVARYVNSFPEKASKAKSTGKA